ncbi:MAG: hypothetical protein IJ770_04125 [Alphaproteobacteria bacterium]|nr:hypothetical protein [Alphaproteobacteria bacterium]
MLNIERQKIENIFFDFMRQKGVTVKPPLSFLPPESDQSIYFTNATIVNFKEDLLSGASQYKATKQKCLRLHHISKVLDDDYKIQWLSLFNMVGTVIPPHRLQQGKNDLIELMTQRYGVPEDKLVFMVNSRDERLYRDIPPQMLIFDSHQQKYYDWHFGMDNISGAGLTFGIKQNDGTIVDVGNLIEINDDKHILGYECAYGLECMQWAKEEKSSILDTYPIFRYADTINDEVIKTVDTAMSIAAVESVGVEPTNKTQRGQILKKLHRNLFYLAERNNLENKQLVQVFNVLQKTEFDEPLNIDKIMTHYKQSQSLIECQRSAFLKHKESLLKLYGDGIITAQEAEKKMMNWAEGKYYIDRHEREKYCSLPASDNNLPTQNLLNIKKQANER